MDYEKAYKDALERARGIHSFSSDIAEIKRMEQIFPELAESENERIRKVQLDYWRSVGGKEWHGVPVQETIAWLEKQGGQKPADKVEPKFKIGDWIINRTDATIMQIVNNIDFYESVEIGGQRRTDTYNYVEWDFRLWTIQDAKEGDVLATPSWAFIYNGNNGGGSCPGSYCGINTLGRFQTDVEHHWTGKKVYPATKEQRELLFAKMREAGYEWDKEKKELSKIEKQGQKPTLRERYENIAQSEWFKRTHDGMSISDDEESAWTEEDEKYIDNCCLLIGAADDCYEKTFKDDCIHYLQSLKERIACKPMLIKQKDIDDLVFDFKWSSENFKNKRVTDIYRQGIYDVMELLKQRIEEL